MKICLALFKREMQIQTAKYHSQTKSLMVEYCPTGSSRDIFIQKVYLRVDRRKTDRGMEGREEEVKMYMTSQGPFQACRAQVSELKKAVWSALQDFQVRKLWHSLAKSLPNHW